MLSFALLASLLALSGCVPGKQYKSAVTGLDSCRSELELVSQEADSCEKRLAAVVKERDQVVRNNSILVETNARLTLQAETERKDAARDTDTMKTRLLECEFHVGEFESLLTECRSAMPEEPLVPAEITNAPAENESEVEESPIVEEAAPAAPSDGRLEALYSDIYVVLRAEIDAGSISIAIQDRVLTAVVPSDILFRVASSTINDSGEDVLIKLSEAMRGYSGFRLDVGAHTDNVGPSARLKKKYESNWELSAARSVIVAKYMARVLRNNEWKISATAYSSSLPLAPNDTDENKARNRRVEFRVTR